MQEPIYATVNAFTVFSERPGEPGFFVDNATSDFGARCEPFIADGHIVAMLERMLDVQTTVPVQLSLDGSKAEFVVVDGLIPGSNFLLSDGQRRFFDLLSRRPVDRVGRRISLDHAEHNARNFARSQGARLARAA